MSYYLVNHRALFLHIPRTGGTWVGRALAAAGIEYIRRYKKRGHYDRCLPVNHLFAGHHWRKYHADTPFCLCWSVVRHPLTYYPSVWRWLRSGSMRPRWNWHPHMTAARLWRPVFGDWVNSLLDQEPSWYTRLVEGYVGPEGGEYCEWIGRTRTLTSDLIEGLRYCGVELRADQVGVIRGLDRANVSTGESPLWPAGVEERVLHEERALLRRFYGPATMDKRVFIPATPDSQVVKPPAQRD